MDYFPLGLASGAAFCNRQQERAHLKFNIEKLKPTLVISPRRYGKTSLVLQVLHETKALFSHIDLFAEATHADIENSLFKAVGAAITKIIPTPQRALRAAQQFFTEMKVKLVLQKSTMSLELEHSGRSRKDQLKELLFKLNEFTEKYHKKIVLFVDEFQRVGQIPEAGNLEATLRQVAQQARNLMFIFSGSNRHLLKQIFEDRNRPFYKLCDRIGLGRISSDHYTAHIQQAAQKTWNKLLTPDIINAILSYSECHSYYVNLLCSRLWLDKKTPTMQAVDASWQKLIEEEKSQISAELDLLSVNQRKLLIQLARREKVFAPLAKEFAQQSSLSTSSIAQSLAMLEQRDYIYRNNDGFYQLLDPLMKAVLSTSR